ncbi:MAG: Asp-tRNA(Asn)/Glu-tRNA(Gln) amidotransferase subunit GatB [Gammaproteobacteria bacterium]|nr:Asp-tRNA(Asn)/Glu-tRNA(Gln) amidotransferase subunit GatB [Gammaproteobacteria bacterium]
MNWETVIGLEVHVQLATKSKIFSGSSTTFGAEANTQASLIDLGMPGTLPVFNEEALRMAVKFGLASHSSINHRSAFDRKNYFYPDLPKGYQTTQLHEAIVNHGYVDIPLENNEYKRINVLRAHLEEDAGKSLHEDFQGHSGIDLNRAGTPLIEIVSEPELSNAKEAVAYLRIIHTLIRYLGISDGNMAEGSMRCDANVSVRPVGQKELGTRTEIKNINSFRFVERAINTEVERQIDLIESGGRVIQATRLYDSIKNETRPMRSKEEANDYRYFPCPDLLPIEIDDAYIEAVRDSLPELPDQKATRFQKDYQLSAYDAEVLVVSRELADYFERCVQTSKADAKLCANWVTGTLLGALNKGATDIEQSPVSAEKLGGLIARIADSTISGKIAKTVFDALWDGANSADEVIEKEGLRQVTDSSAIQGLVNEVVDQNPEQVESYRAADEKKRKKMFGFFVGQIMKASKGKANPQQVNQLLLEKLEK